MNSLDGSKFCPRRSTKGDRPKATEDPLQRNSLHLDNMVTFRKTLSDCRHSGFKTYDSDDEREEIESDHGDHATNGTETCRMKKIRSATFAKGVHRNCLPSSNRCSQTRRKNGRIQGAMDPLKKNSLHLDNQATFRKTLSLYRHGNFESDSSGDEEEESETFHLILL